jgi:catechol 2,3-dioxygenase-like lactoylglutathione lyase family enzyme
MKLAGVHHVSINVDDVEATGRFYTEVLGLEKLPRPDFGFPGMWLRCQGQEIHLIHDKDHKAGAPRPGIGPHFAFRVEDLDAVVEELRRKQVEVSQVFEIPGGARQCFIHDPAGNMIELNQPAR